MKKTLVGKTISKIRKNAINSWKIVCSDGTIFHLSTDDCVHTPYGSIPGLFLELEKKAWQILLFLVI